MMEAMSGGHNGSDGLPDRLFRLLVDRTAVPFVVIDLEGTVVHASTSVSVVVGWAPERVIGRSILDFIEPEGADLALAALGEIDSLDRMDSALPIVFPVTLPDGGTRHVEVAAMPLVDAEAGALVALRLRSWEAERHMSQFVRAMVAGEPLAQDLERLTRSLASSMEGVAASVHHGFDGTAFHGVAGSWAGAACLPLATGPWMDALDHGDVLQVPVDDPDGAPAGAVTVWLKRVQPRSGLPPAVLSVWRARPDAPFLGHRQAFAQACDFVELAIVRAAEHDRLVHLARHDPLTGVANRATFRDLLSETLARGERDIAVGFCDLDDFKDVNDRHGHRLGDALLVEVVARLRRGLRAGDEIARIGGDEFAVLWRNIPDAETAHAAAARLVAAGDEPFPVPGGTMHVGVSVGVALARPGDTAESLLAAADVTTYESKKAGGGQATMRVAS
jgi:diguanylate cyclase (GGDEF)-like protein/PAS domain S-box-containing protein